MSQGNQTDSTLEFCCEIVASCLGYQILALCRWSTTFNLLASFKATQSITGLGMVSEKKIEINLLNCLQGNQTNSTLELCCEIVASCLGYQIIALCR